MKVGLKLFHANAAISIYKTQITTLTRKTIKSPPPLGNNLNPIRITELLRSRLPQPRSEARRYHRSGFLYVCVCCVCCVCVCACVCVCVCTCMDVCVGRHVWLGRMCVCGFITLLGKKSSILFIYLFIIDVYKARKSAADFRQVCWLVRCVCLSVC